MKFAIATVEFFNRLGYDTTYWRKSIDGKKAICHLSFAEILDNKIGKHAEILTVEEAKEVMNTKEWALDENEEEPTDE